MRKSVCTVMVASMLLTACASDGQGNKQTIGAVGGAVGGALLGSLFGKGTGKYVAIAAGAVIGGLIGSEIGKSLDEADRQALEKKSVQTLSNTPDGQTVSWSNPESGASAQMTPSQSRTTERQVAIAREADVSPATELDLIGDTWEAAKPARVRKSPSANAPVALTLGAGETFTAVGKVTGTEWVMAARDNHTIGYVQSSLVRPATRQQTSQAQPLRKAVDMDAVDQAPPPAQSAGLVTDKVKVKSRCRTMNYAVKTKDGGSSNDNFEACKAPDGAWEII